jgi:hypothetical protein
VFTYVLTHPRPIQRATLDRPLMARTVDRLLGQVSLYVGNITAQSKARTVLTTNVGQTTTHGMDMYPPYRTHAIPLCVGGLVHVEALLWADPPSMQSYRLQHSYFQKLVLDWNGREGFKHEGWRILDHTVKRRPTSKQGYCHGFCQSFWTSHSRHVHYRRAYWDSD